MIMSKKLTANEVIEKFRKAHGNKYDYSRVNYINNRTPVCIICPIHGKFNQRPHSHYNRKHECHLCGNNKIREKLVSNKEEFMKKANMIHKNKYDYSKLIYINALTKGTIICPIHGEFQQILSGHLNSGGCKKCGTILTNNSNLLSTEEFIEKSIKIHGNKYDYSMSKYINSHEKIYIICKKHKEFRQTANSHLNGNGCPTCIHIISKSEIEFLDYVKIPQTEENRQKYIKPYKVDGYDPITNTVYEYLGNYYHGNPDFFDQSKYNQKCHKTFGELYKNTFIKFDNLKSLGYNVKYIWESDWEKYKNGSEHEPKVVTH